MEVLIGRSIVQAKYELIEHDERQEYLSHKKQYEQVREFELINLQRMEAARIRREEEKARRQNQVIQKKMHDIIIQKKLISKISAKSYLVNLKKNALSQLVERGYLKDNFSLKLSGLLEKNLYPASEKKSSTLIIR